MSKSTNRTLDIFELFARERRPLNLSELAKAIGVAPSSCFSVVKTLKSRGFLYEIGERRLLYPTRRMLEDALAIAEYEPHLARLVPVMEALRDVTGETIIIGRRQTDNVVYLKVAEGPHTVRYTARVGEIKPMHSSAIGKVVLASMNEEERRIAITRLPMKKMTDHTISRPRELLANIEEGLARGYQMTTGENVADVVAVAMPLRVGSDNFGICIAGPRHRMESRHAEHAATLAAALRSFAAAQAENPAKAEIPELMRK